MAPECGGAFPGRRYGDASIQLNARCTSLTGAAARWRMRMQKEQGLTLLLRLVDQRGDIESYISPCATLLRCSCALKVLNRGRNLSQSMRWASSSGPSMQACLRIILPSTVIGTMQAPHMPVASTMIELRLATVFTP